MLSGRLITERFVSPQNAYFFIYVTVWGNLTSINEGMEATAYCGISFMPSANSMVSILPHPENAEIGES